MEPIPQPLLHLRPAVRRLRRRGDLPVPVGGAVPRARVERAHRDVRVHRHPRRRPVLRVAEAGPAVVLSAPRPAIDLARVASALAAKLGNRARVTTLHDMVVLDVDGDRLAEGATLVRDDPLTRCDLYSVNARAATRAALLSVTFLRRTTPHAL